MSTGGPTRAHRRRAGPRTAGLTVAVAVVSLTLGSCSAAPTGSSAPLTSAGLPTTPGLGTTAVAGPASTGSATTAETAPANSDPDASGAGGAPTSEVAVTTSASSAAQIGTSERIDVNSESSADTAAGSLAESAAQSTLDAFGDWLRSQPGIDDSGYIQSVDDEAGLATTLIWYGTSPLQDAAQREAANRGITVTITEWPFSAADLESAAMALYDQTDAFLDLGFTVNDISAIPPDFAGVDLCGQYLEGAAPNDEAVRQLAASLTDIPVRLDSACDGTAG